MAGIGNLTLSVERFHTVTVKRDSNSKPSVDTGALLKTQGPAARKGTRQNTSRCFQCCKLERACQWSTPLTALWASYWQSWRTVTWKSNKDIWQDLWETFLDEKQVGKTFIHLLYDLRATCAYGINCKLTIDQRGNFTMRGTWRDVLLIQMSHVSQIEPQVSYSIS